MRFEFRLQCCRTPAPLELHSRFLINKRMCSFKGSDPFLEPGAGACLASCQGPGIPGESVLQGLLERALCSEVCTQVRRSLGGNLVGRLRRLTLKRRVVDTLRDTVCFNKLTITLERSYSCASSSPGSLGPAKCTELFINWHEQGHSNSRMSWRPHHQGRRNREWRKAPKAVVSQMVNVAAEASPRSVCFTQSQIHSS